MVDIFTIVTRIICGIIFTVGAFKYDNPFFMLIAFIWFAGAIWLLYKYIRSKLNKDEEDDMEDD